MKLVTLDVGYTLGEPIGTTLTQRLVALSPLPEVAAKSVAQRLLHTVNPQVDSVAEAVCAGLHIPADAFPFDHCPPSFVLWPGAREAVARMAKAVLVVTLSNVTYWDERASDIAELLAPHIACHYPSWRLGYAKPDPQAVEAVARLHGVLPAEVLHVGDSLDYDVRGALAAGAQALWITPHPPTGEGRRLLAAHPGRVTAVSDLDTAATHIEQAAEGPASNTLRRTAP